MEIPLGVYNCFACNAKGHWNSFAAKTGLATIKEWQNRPGHVANLEVGLDDQLLGVPGTLTSVMKTLGNPGWLPWPADRVWRGFGGEFVRQVGGLMINDRVTSSIMLFLPVEVNSAVVGGIKASVVKRDGQLSYITSRGAWVRDYGLFPYDYTRNLLVTTGYKYIILVEGPRDALRLLHVGIPALAILGSKNFGPRKAMLAANIVPNLSKIVSFPDNDAAGDSMDQRVVACCANLGVPTVSVGYGKLATGLDPASVPLEFLHKLHRKLL